MFKFVIILLIALPVSLFSQVFRGQMLPENCEFVKNISVQLVRQDSKDRVWVYSVGSINDSLMVRENGVWRGVYKNLLGPGDFLEDKYGNILIPTSDKLFVYKNDGTIQIVNEGSLNYLYQVCIVDTSVYFSNLFNGSFILPEAGYDKSSNSYKFVKTLVFSDTILIHTPYGVVEKNKELYYVCEKGLFVYNTVNKTYRIIRHPELDVFTVNIPPRDRPDNAGMYIDSNGVISILTTIGRKPAVMRIYSDDSIKTYIYPHYISYAVSDGTGGIDSKLFPVNNEQSEFLFSANKDLLYFSEKTGIMYIPQPPEIKWWEWCSMFDMSIVDGDEIWFGTLSGGIIRCGLKELLATKTEQPPAGVEDIVPYIAMMDIYSVYPQPGSQYVDIDYFLQTCNFSENKIKIYDTYGQEVTKFKFEVLRDKGMMRTLRINTEGFSSGGYVVEITDGDNRATGKFLIK